MNESSPIMSGIRVSVEAPVLASSVVVEQADNGWVMTLFHQGEQVGDPKMLGPLSLIEASTIAAKSLQLAWSGS